MAAEGDTLIGQVIDGRFEIRDRLGQGGMGTVYRAWQHSVQREVAIKLIDKNLAGEPMAVERFTREARLSSQLSHPNTISVVDFGTLSDGRFFIAMELVRGRTLGKILRTDGALSLDRVVRIGVQICDALTAAHALRIVHRDLKPDNVMVLDGTADLIKVLDFGLAKRIDDTSAGTGAGIVVGTPRYIPPETAMSGQASPAGDLYALGVILAEMALGTPLWEGESLAAILQLQLEPAPRLRSLPEPLRPIVAGLLESDPARRTTADQLRLQLLALGTGAEPALPAPTTLAGATVSMKKTPKRTPEAPTHSRWVLPAALGGGMLVTGGVLAFVLARGHEHAPRPDAAHGPTAPTTAAADAGAADDPWTRTTPPPDTTSNNDYVRIWVIGVPDHIALTLDGLPCDNPFSVPRDTAKHRLEGTVEGALYLKVWFAPNEDKTLDATASDPSECDVLTSDNKRACLMFYCARHIEHPRCR
ncbi:MAG TPA: serine/threonine-protein kinase [Kofleriaceae bacterium]|nr:serine/threonine-protein kinase [Kofleriaceae bacterium]